MHAHTKLKEVLSTVDFQKVEMLRQHVTEKTVIKARERQVENLTD